MMKFLLPIFIICFLTLGCDKDDDSVINTYGTVLKSINRLNEGGNTYVETFDYEEDNLVTVESFYETGSVNGYDFKLNYLDNQLITINRIKKEDQSLFAKDSFVYDANDRLEKIFLINRNGEQDLTIFLTYEFAYDDENRIIADTTVSDFFVHRDSFRWENGNIVQKDQFDETGLRHSFFYKYDDKINPKKNLAYFYKQPIFQSKNNIIEESATDFTGLLDLYCNPCKHNYTYNLDDMPLKITYDWEQKLEFTYQ